MIYRRRATPLHAARAGVSTAWLAAIGVAVLIEGNPIVLGVLLGAILLAGARARVGRPLARACIYAAAMAGAVCVINALVSRDGFTVIWRFGDLPIIGQTNVTLEALVYGGILGMRAAELVLLGALYSLTVDPDEVLRAMRRFSFGSALSAAVATRMVPILVRDGRRLAEAQRCRPGRPPGRLALMRATTSGALDRALDLAATLEVRGFSEARRTQRGGGPAGAWSRHDLAFAASATVILATVLLARAQALAQFRSYPALGEVLGTGVLAISVVLAAAILAPNVASRGTAR